MSEQNVFELFDNRLNLKVSVFKDDTYNEVEQKAVIVKKIPPYLILKGLKELLKGVNLSDVLGETKGSDLSDADLNIFIENIINLGENLESAFPYFIKDVDLKLVAEVEDIKELLFAVYTVNDLGNVIKNLAKPPKWYNKGNK